jgi:hypothetical protein
MTDGCYVLGVSPQKALPGIRNVLRLAFSTDCNSGWANRPGRLAKLTVIATTTEDGRCVTGALPFKEEDGLDRSMADFLWGMMAEQRGWNIEETPNKLLEVSANA